MRVGTDLRAWVVVLAALGVAAGGCAEGNPGGDGAVCNNGLLEQGEQCDGFDLGGMDCASLGMGVGALKCFTDCTYDTSGCSNASVCGNGAIEGNEDCDGMNLAGRDCAALNLGSGALSCTATCQFDTSGCSMSEQCGNGVVEGTEDCDGYNLNGKSCAAVLGPQYTGGALSCTAGCEFDTSGCSDTGAQCGNDVLEAGEACDGDTFQGGATCVSLGYGGGILACTASCTIDDSGCTSAAEDCDNGTDDDGDGFVDCNDGDCFSDPICGGSAEDCGNGQDDDQDGFIDCDDSDCSSDPACQGTGGEICDNGVDDDGMFGCDCADIMSCLMDLNCLLAPGSETVCDDGVDDDLDCLVDCADDDCATDPACGGAVEVCDNQTDDDSDGDVDCEDADCAGDPACPLCTGVTSIACGDTLSGDTTGGPEVLSSEYGCGQYDETGPEAYFSFAPAAGGSVTVDLVGTGSGDPDLELMLVGDTGGDCDPAGQCLDASQQSGGTEQLSFSATAGTTYYLIVEGYSGAAGPFDLTVTCN